MSEQPSTEMPSKEPKPGPAPERTSNERVPVASGLKPVSNEISPDALMQDFRGKKVLLLVLATMLVHVVLILGSSYGYIRDTFFGSDTAELSKEKRIEAAMGKVRTTLGQIAKDHNLDMDDLIDNLAGAGSRASRLQDAKKPPAKDKKEPAEKEPEKKEPEKKEPKKKVSELEKTLPGPKTGPKIPKADDADTTGLP